MADSNTSQDIQSLYLALLGRAADPDGLNYWTSQAPQQNLSQLATAFTASSEYQQGSGTLSSQEAVASLYRDLFDRDGEDAGVSYWTQRLDSGELDRNQLATALIAGASEADSEALNAKLAIAEYYSNQVTAENYDAEQALTYQQLHTNDELYAELQRLDEQYDTLDLAQVGSSLEGNPLYRAEIGNGPRTLMLATQQHGDEPLGTEAALTLMDYLAGDSEEAQTLREQVTLVVMPRVNPDGFARWQQQVEGAEDLLDPRLNAAGVDLNRTYDPSADYSDTQAPESDAVKQVVAQYQPELLIDYHNQNNYRAEDGSLDTTSILWATNDNASDEVMQTGQRAAVAIDQALEDYSHDQLTLYPGSDNPAIGRNGLGIDGTPTLLMEQRGLQEMGELADGLDQDFSALASALTLEGVIGIGGVLASLADGSFDDLDPDQALSIPERSEGISFAEVYGDDAFEPEPETPMAAEEAQLAGLAPTQDEALIA